MLKLPVSPEKLKLTARGFAKAAVSFIFFRRNSQFQHLAKSQFHETEEKFNFYPKRDTKSVLFIVSFKWNWREKKTFPYKTDL